MEERILLLAPRGRDAQVIEQLLKRLGQFSRTCSDLVDLTTEVAVGAGTALITEESLSPASQKPLVAWLKDQPPWSDFPFILLATKRSGRRPAEAIRFLTELGNVVVLERPIHAETLASAVNSALRVRRRQYEARHRMLELQTAEERLTQLNATLESRIAERTEALSRANNRLMQEVSERERAQAALVQSQKMEAVGQLTGGIAHDFNNLLTVIIGNLEMIQRRTAEDRITLLAGYASKAADRAAKLTQQLLAFSRTQNLTLRPVDLNQLIEGMSDLLVRTIGTQITIDMQLGKASPWAMADANQLELAILNLAINARDAMPEGGVLVIRSEIAEAPPGGELTPGRYGVVSVRDTGTGIPPNLLGKVFDPFFTTKPIGKGTGLGLSQVFGIAQQSGGGVKLESSEGQGTRIDLWFPLAPPTGATAGGPVAASPDAARLVGRILVIDDDDGVRRFIAECLEMLGVEVVQASSGTSGIDRMARRRPDLLIVDYAMPGMNGVDVIREARRRIPDIPVILSTGYADMEAVGELDGLAGVLRKPFRIDDLNSMVRRVLVGLAAH